VTVAGAVDDVLASGIPGDAGEPLEQATAVAAPSFRTAAVIQSFFFDGRAWGMALSSSAAHSALAVSRKCGGR
jgi:hypothetical protein